VRLVGLPCIRPVIHPAGLILPCAATRSAFCCSSSSSSSSPSYIQPGFLSRTDTEPARPVIRPCPPSVHPSGRPCGSTSCKLPGCRLHAIPLLSLTLQHGKESFINYMRCSPPPPAVVQASTESIPWQRVRKKKEEADVNFVASSRVPRSSYNGKHGKSKKIFSSTAGTERLMRPMQSSG